MAPRDPTHEIFEAACDLLEAARAIEQAAGRGGVVEAIPATLGALEETLQVLSASCYRLAGDCAPNVAPGRVHGTAGRAAEASPPLEMEPFSRENQAFLMSTLHDVASRVARASRGCRDGREVTAPLIAKKLKWERRMDDATETPAPPSQAGIAGQPPARQLIAPPA